jgi:hypothetical protein
VWQVPGDRGHVHGLDRLLDVAVLDTLDATAIPPRADDLPRARVAGVDLELAHEPQRRLVEPLRPLADRAQRLTREQ